MGYATTKRWGAQSRPYGRPFVVVATISPNVGVASVNHLHGDYWLSTSMLANLSNELQRFGALISNNSCEMCLSGVLSVEFPFPRKKAF